MNRPRRRRRSRRKRCWHSSTASTPLDSYNPDWAIAFKEGSVKHLYFVAETKGALSDLQLRAIEKSKIACAEKFFMTLGTKDTRYHVTYRKVASYKNLIDMASSDVEASVTDD